MKKHIFVLSAALFAAMLSGCGRVEPPSAPEVSEPTRIMPIESSPPESAAPSEETSESTESVPDYPVKNEAGYIKTISNYDQGELISTETETCDVHGNVIKESSKWGDYYYAYEYNADGTVRVKYSEDGREEYDYENGLEVKCTKYDENGKEHSVKTRTYDEYGNETSLVREMDGSSVLSSVFGYELDENGNWIAEYSYDDDGKIDMSSTCVRDENGNIISGTLIDKNSVLTYEYKYDERGNEIDYHSVNERDGKVTRERHIVTEYDDHGRISRESEYRIEDGEERLVTRSEYEYL